MYDKAKNEGVSLLHFKEWIEDQVNKNTYNMVAKISKYMRRNYLSYAAHYYDCK